MDALEAAIANNQTALSEFQSKRLLSAVGIPVTREKKVSEADGMLIYFLASIEMVRKALVGMGVPEEELDTQIEDIVETHCNAIASLVKTHGKPIVGFSFLTRENPFVAGLQDRGVPVLPSPERAARAFGAMANHKRLQDKIVQCDDELGSN